MITINWLPIRRHLVCHWRSFVLIFSYSSSEYSFCFPLSTWTREWWLGGEGDARNGGGYAGNGDLGDGGDGAAGNGDWGGDGDGDAGNGDWGGDGDIGNGDYKKLMIKYRM